MNEKSPFKSETTKFPKFALLFPFFETINPVDRVKEILP